jgi:hypothetical protein
VRRRQDMGHFAAQMRFDAVSGENDAHFSERTRSADQRVVTNSRHPSEFWPCFYRHLRLISKV